MLGTRQVNIPKQLRADGPTAIWRSTRRSSRQLFPTHGANIPQDGAKRRAETWDKRC